MEKGKKALKHLDERERLTSTHNTCPIPASKIVQKAILQATQRTVNTTGGKRNSTVYAYHQTQSLQPITWRGE